MISFVVFYALLVAFTIFIFRNAFKVWKVYNDFTFPLSTLIIFYFTIAGAYIFPLDVYSGFQGYKIGLHYLPIFDRLFPVGFDKDYFISCIYYAIFILAYQYTYMIFVRKYLKSNNIDIHENKKQPFEIVINPWLVMAISFVCIFISAYIMKKEIYYAVAHEKSIYLITRSNNNPFYTLHQLGNEFCVLIPFIAYSLTLIRSDYFNIKVSNRVNSFYILIFTCFIASLYISCLGNRREILSGFVICILICVNKFKGIDWKRFSVLLVVVLAMFFSNDFFRSRVIPRELNSFFNLVDNRVMNEEIVDPQISSKADSKIDLKSTIGSVLLSNELFYAHFSMYGAIHHKIPLTYGSSYLYLATSVIPRNIYPNRPIDSYSYYALAVKAIPGQIYTIHHATACYINFGVPGVIFGGIVLGVIFAFGFCFNFYTLKRRNTFLILLKYLIPFLLCGQLVTFITAGPEAYKSMILEGVVIPILLLWLCSKQSKTGVQESNNQLSSDH